MLGAHTPTVHMCCCTGATFEEHRASRSLHNIASLATSVTSLWLRHSSSENYNLVSVVFPPYTIMTNWQKYKLTKNEKTSRQSDRHTDRQTDRRTYTRTDSKQLCKKPLKICKRGSNITCCVADHSARTCSDCTVASIFRDPRFCLSGSAELPTG